MRTEFAIALAMGLICGSQAGAPTYSCFDPPDEGQTNPLGEGFEDVVGADCCDALTDESDIIAGRLVYWDPVNCNHGPGLFAISEAALCRAHDTDGCRFCRETCEDFEGLCITCDEVAGSALTSAPTATPTPGMLDSTPAPVMVTEMPFGIFPDTPSPLPRQAVTEAPTTEPAMMSPGDDEDNCMCLTGMSDVEREVMALRGKTMRCDTSCSDGSDLTWGVINCNYFALGQNCRACSESCAEDADGLWFDQFGIICKPCDAIV